MQEWLISLSINHTVWVYVFIVFFAFAEGPILSMVFGIIIKLGYFDFMSVYVALMVGDLIGDIFWYCIGFYYGHSFIKKFGKYFSVTEQSLERAKSIFHKHKHPILFISKITNGFGFALATLIAAGMVKLPFKKYLAVNIAGQFIWTGLLISTGYFLGDFYLKVDTIFSRIMFVFVIVILFILIANLRKIVFKETI
jgi:membrane protein DedA with SNARE-associated domain